MAWATRNLPRHQFGNLQGKMFPAYFTLISACAAVSVAAFAYLHPWKAASAVERYQLGFLISALGFNLSNLLVFTPMTIEEKPVSTMEERQFSYNARQDAVVFIHTLKKNMMKKRHKIERELSIGDEVGWSKNVKTAKSNPTLAAMNKKFGMIHGLSSLANILSFGSLAMHSWYLASKLEL
uniref:TMEM205-like domain-containing protein n=1 Tax=Aegilops tauschii TaxID=37682 RepID=M8B7V4_AEGTA